MKKIKKIITIIILLLVISPIVVNAEGITKYLINSTIMQNGDLEIEEYFYMSGYYNGFERIIDYNNEDAPIFNPNLELYGGSQIHNGNGITLETVKALKTNSNFDFTNIPDESFKEVNYKSESGEFGVYTKENTNTGVKLRIYLPSSENKAFYIKYIIHNIAILHNDVGELGWNIVGNSLSENIDYLEAIVNIPNNINDLKGWAHGPLNGKIEILSANKIKVSIDNLPSYEAIDIRATFNKNVISNSQKLTNVNALDKILKYEQIEADKANMERDRINKIIQNDALDAVIELENLPSKDNYYNAIEKTNLIGDQIIKEEYMNRIKSQKDNVEKYQVNITEQYIQKTLKSKKYEDYKIAEESIQNVEKKENIILLNKKLKEVKKLIIKKENRSEFIIIFIHLGIMIIMYFLYKMKDIDFSMIKYQKDNIKYLRDFPSDLHPSSVGYLFNREGTSNQIVSNLLLLLDKKVISSQKVAENNYLFTIKNKDFLSDIDKAFIKMFFNGKNKITSKEFEKLSHKSNIKPKYINYIGVIQKDLLEKKLMKDEPVKKEITINFDMILITIVLSLYNKKIMLIVLPILLIYLLIKHGIKSSTFSMFIFITSIIINIFTIYYTITHNNFIFYSIYVSIILTIINIVLMVKSFTNKIERTKKGNEESSKWYKFKSFINSFSSFNEKELPELCLWNKYLIYATTLGCANKISNILAEKVSHMNTIDNSLSLVSNIDDFLLISKSLNYSIHNNNRILYKNQLNFSSPILKTAGYLSANSSSDSWSSSSNHSSGSGSGGGFSGGSGSGGSFGGGGGGGRF